MVDDDVDSALVSDQLPNTSHSPHAAKNTLTIRPLMVDALVALQGTAKALL